MSGDTARRRCLNCPGRWLVFHPRKKLWICHLCGFTTKEKAVSEKKHARSLQEKFPGLRYMTALQFVRKSLPDAKKLKDADPGRRWADCVLEASSKHVDPKILERQRAQAKNLEAIYGANKEGCAKILDAFNETFPEVAKYSSDVRAELSVRQGTVTGRLSSRSRDLREVLRPRSEGNPADAHAIVAPDYSALEIRVLAAILAKDEKDLDENEKRVLETVRKSDEVIERLKKHGITVGPKES